MRCLIVETVPIGEEYSEERDPASVVNADFDGCSPRNEKHRPSQGGARPKAREPLTSLEAYFKEATHRQCFHSPQHLRHSVEWDFAKPRSWELPICNVPSSCRQCDPVIFPHIRSAIKEGTEANFLSPEPNHGTFTRLDFECTFPVDSTFAEGDIGIRSRFHNS